MSRESEVKIILIRDKDEFINFKDRIAFANQENTDMLLNLHCDATGDRAHWGMTLFFSEKSESYQKSLEFGQILVSQLQKEVTDKAEINSANMYILKDSDIPAVQLHMRFLSNEFNRHQLKDPTHQKEIASGIYQGLLNIQKSN